VHPPNLGEALQHYKTQGDKQRDQGGLYSGNRHQTRSTSANQCIIRPMDYQACCQAEMDTRADTICAGKTFIMLEDTGRVCDVRGFHGQFEPLKGIPITTCTMAYDYAKLQETLILMFYECLYFGGDMENSHICPNQLHDNEVTVDLCPKQYSHRKSLHGIHIPKEDIILPLELFGCISYFPSQLLTLQELMGCHYIYLTKEKRVGSIFILL